MAVGNLASIPVEAPRAQTVSPSDGELLARVAKADHAAFRTLVQRHHTRFYRVAYRFIRQRETTEDIVQEAFLKLWERPEMWQFERNTAFTTWFYRVVVNLCLDYRKKKTPTLMEDNTWVIDTQDSQEESLAHRQRENWLASQIADLPERQQTALNLCFYEELSNQEAADIMGVRLKALQSLLMRAKTTLQQKLKETKN